MVNIGIVGGTGYTGVELVRLLTAHPEVRVEIITSRSNAGTMVADVFPNLRGKVDLVYTEPGVDSYKNCDLVFFATPNTIAMTQAEALLGAGIKLIDLAADFRIKDIATWEKWYGATHACPSLVEQAVYGLPELNRESIKSANLVANPGCYPTSVILALLPLLKHEMIEPTSIIADCKSGVSGAGRGAAIAAAYCEVTESVKAYGVGGHRHLPEIRAILQTVNNNAELVFTPHLMPMIRGLHATVYADAQGSGSNPQKIFEAFYQDEPFVDVMPTGSHPETRSVRGTNHCRIAAHYLADSNKYIVLAVIDNLVKGAAGQAIQNMNLMLGFDESIGLEAMGMIP
jgi:N-acetyl-gamma-glutamyl-phosphate reductase